MTELEKVITGLECCSVKQSCSECPWMGLDCNDRLHLAALELLKEQQETIISLQHIINKLNEAIAEHPKRKRGHWGLDCSVKPAIYVCSTCRFKAKEMSKYCPNCGMRTEEAL